MVKASRLRLWGIVALELGCLGAVEAPLDREIADLLVVVKELQRRKASLERFGRG